MNADIMTQLNSSANWSALNPSGCPCGGSGWLLSDFDTWHKCHTHNIGQPFPEFSGDDDTFDHGAALLRLQRTAYRVFAGVAGVALPEFNEMVRARLDVDNSASAWVDAAEDIALDAANKRAKPGYSFGF